jgi:hypothetical protein
MIVMVVEVNPEDEEVIICWQKCYWKNLYTPRC